MLEALQKLFKSSIENGFSSEHYYFILSILTVFVSSLCGSYFGSYFKKRGEEQAIRADFADIKERLSQTTKLIII